MHILLRFDCYKGKYTELRTTLSTQKDHIGSMSMNARISDPVLASEGKLLQEYCLSLGSDLSLEMPHSILDLPRNYC